MKNNSASNAASRAFRALVAFSVIFAGSVVVRSQAAPNNAAKPVSAMDDTDCDPVYVASPYIPVDSWIYPAVLRLYSLGYIDSAFLNMRPWTRSSLRHMLEETADRLEDTEPADQSEARKLYDAVTSEIDRFGSPYNCANNGYAAHLDSTYTVARAISGTPLRDSFHLGSTIVNDYGRPYRSGFNNYTGASGYAAAGRFLIYARGEFQGAPSTAGYSASLATQLAAEDNTTNYYTPACWASNTSCTPIPYNQQSTIPAGPIAMATQGRLLEAYVSAEYLNHVVSFGKQDYWQSPAVGGSMSYSNNAENIYSFRINRIEPLQVPLLSKVTGPFRYEFMIGPLRGHLYPRNPWVHAEKISFHPTGNLEFGFERTAIWGGEGHEPITLKTFLKSFFSVTAPGASVKNSRSDPGARFGAFDFSYRLPYLRNWLTLYADGEVHDDVSPIDAPRRAAWRPGIYLSHFPHLSRLDLRLEAATTDPPVRTSNGGHFMYWEVMQRQGYTNNGQIFGDWIGREAKGGQGWLTYHLSGNEWIQAGFRSQKTPKDFIQGGTTLNDINFQLVKRIRPDLEINGLFQFQNWKAPVYLPGKQLVTATTIQVTWFPKK